MLPGFITLYLSLSLGFGVSMLKRLAEQHPFSVAQLTYQYRMHEDICQLSNDIVYKGRLKCADVTVAHRILSLSGFPENLPSVVRADSRPWLKQAIDPSSAVVFLNTDTIEGASPHHDSPGTFSPLERSNGRKVGGSIVNDAEASLVRICVGGLLACGLDASSIGVICPFRAQLRLLGDCPSLGLWKAQGLELSTIDRYQGRDKSAIVLSFVRSNAKGKVGRLLQDFRRLNVAVTRAKSKLIMIGSFSTLYNGSEVLQPVLERLQSERRIMELPRDATSSYSV
jgi:DNA replication ATP-dependent helicase Dna2